MDWHEFFTYEPETGILRWKERPLEQFYSAMHHKAWNTRRIGSEAGTKTSYNGGVRKCISVVLMIDGKRIRMKAHRIIWEMHHGPIGDGLVIDHKDGDPWNNRLDNLQEATLSQNAHNSIMKRTNTSGYKGVTWSAAANKWVAQIWINWEHKYLGCFATKEEAAEAYKAAATELHGKFACVSRPTRTE